MDTEELQQVIVNQAVQIDKLTRKLDTYKKSNLSMAQSKLKDLIRIEVLQEWYVAVTDASLDAVDEEVDKRLHEHYELNHS